MLRLSLVALLLCVQGAYCQPPEPEWSHAFGGREEDRCHAVARTSDGGYALAGWSYSWGTGQADVYLVRTNSSGNILWSRRYGGWDADVCWAIQETSDGGLILAGCTMSFGNGAKDFWLLKTNADGDSLWSQTFGGMLNEWATTVRQTSDGGYAVAGWTQSFGNGNFDMWLVKTDSDGNELWNQTYGGVDQDECHDFLQLSDSGYVLAGFTYSYGSGEDDFWLVRTDEDGMQLWSQVYGGGAPERCWALAQTDDDGFLLTGTTMSYGAGAKDFWLVRTDESGEPVWTETYGTGLNEWATGVQETPDGGIVLAGWTQPSDWEYLDGWVVKTDATGAVQWSCACGDDGWDEFQAIQQTPEGAYILAGFTDSFGSGELDFWVMKLHSDEMPITPSEISVPADFVLTAHPNPFNSSTTLQITLPARAAVHVVITDVLGRVVTDFGTADYAAGYHSLSFSGETLATGVYWAVLETGNVQRAQKLLLLK